MFLSSLVLSYSCSWKCTANALLNGLTCVAIVAKLVLKLIWMRRSYTKMSFLCAINVKHREGKSWRGGQYKLPKQTNRGPVVLKTIGKSLRFYKIKVYLEKIYISIFFLHSVAIVKWGIILVLVFREVQSHVIIF